MRNHFTAPEPTWNPTDQIVAHMLGFSSSAVNLSRVFFKHPHPILDVSGSTLRVVPHTDALPRHHGADLHSGAPATPTHPLQISGALRLVP